MTAHTELGLLRDLRTGNDLFRFTALKDLGIVDHGRGAVLLTEHSLQQYSLATIWRLLALEAWARTWLTGQ